MEVAIESAKKAPIGTQLYRHKVRVTRQRTIEEETDEMMVVSASESLSDAERDEIFDASGVWGSRNRSFHRKYDVEILPLDVEVVETSPAVISPLSENARDAKETASV